MSLDVDYLCWWTLGEHPIGKYEPNLDKTCNRFGRKYNRFAFYNMDRKGNSNKIKYELNSKSIIKKK